MTTPEAHAASAHRSRLPRRPNLLAGLLGQLGILVLVAWSPQVASGQDTQDPPSTPKATGESLDDALLKDLDDGLLEGLDDLPLPGPGDSGQPKPAAPMDAGEDIGSEVADPLVRIGRKMQRVESLIAEGKTGEGTLQMQQEIAAELQQLIEQVKKQCNSQGGQGKPKPSSSSSQAAGQGSQPQTESPAAESTERVGQADSGDAELERMRALFKDAWGHLPPRLRERMQNASAEEFLPKYEQMIEEYFKRLAEEPRTGS